MPEPHRQALNDGAQLGLRYALVLPQTAMHGQRGERLGRFAGSSVDFQDHREYQPGDDLRHIDWNAYARSDQLIVKLYREEVQPHLDLILDTSRSMALEDTPKAAALHQLAAVFATAAANSRCSHSVWTTGDGFHSIANDTQPPSAWGEIALNSALPFEEAFGLMPPRLRRQGIRVIISDLFWPGDPLPTLRKLTEGAAAVHVVQLLAREDVEPPEPGNVELRDHETGETLSLYIDATVQQRYRETLKRLQQSWHDATKQTGASLATLLANRVPDSLSRLEEINALEPA